MVKLKKVAVIGRGTAGSLAAASVSKIAQLHDIELHHIYDSSIPVIGVGEGGWPTLVTTLQELTGREHVEIQCKLNGTRKYGVTFEGWGRNGKSFTHYFTPQQVRYSYHLSADLVTELLHEHTAAKYLDKNVEKIINKGETAEVTFRDQTSETYDLVFDARGYPKKIEDTQHLQIDFIPTNKAIIRRCPPIIQTDNIKPYTNPTYTRSIARKYGWVFVIPLTSHTSYGYIFNSDITELNEVEEDFDQLLYSEGMETFEQRAIINFPNFIHRNMYEGSIARIGNAGAFMEPLEATAIVSAQIQIGLILNIRQNRPAEYFSKDVQSVNNFLIQKMLQFGMFVGWHYSCGSIHESKFWSYAKETIWPKYKPEDFSCKAKMKAQEKFDHSLSLLTKPHIEQRDLEKHKLIPITSYAQISHGLGYNLVN